MESYPVDEPTEEGLYLYQAPGTRGFSEVHVVKYGNELIVCEYGQPTWVYKGEWRKVVFTNIWMWDWAAFAKPWK